jgi:hypothetical protein
MIQIDWNPTPRMLRNFGLIGLAAFGLLGLAARGHVWLFARLPPGAVQATAYVLWALAGFCGLFALAAPPVLRPLYLGLTIVSFPIGLALSYVIVTLMFFLVITPIALIFRMIGRDALHRRFDPSAATYWVRRTPPASVKRYFRQF